MNNTQIQPQKISRESIEKIKDLANEKIDLVLSELGLDIDNVTGFSDEIRCSCPVHGGDNPTAFSYNTRFKKWRCYTAGCHEDNTSIFSLVGKIIGKNEGREVSFIESVEWLARLLNIDIGWGSDGHEDESQKEIRSFINQTKFKRRLSSRQVDSIDDTKFRPFGVELIDGKLPVSKYFLNQGFREDVLKKYNVGFCDTVGKPMYLRSYAPVLDETGQMVIGVTGRTIYEKCEFCPEFHMQGYGCPKDNQKIKGQPKWLHYGFKKNYALYNYSFAKKTIENSKVAIITEGPKDIWWLDQHGINNCLSIFGLSFSDYHLKKLVQLGVIKVVLGMDKDKYGIEASEKIQKQLGEYFDIFEMDDFLNYGEDIADISTDKMMNDVVPFIRGISNV